MIKKFIFILILMPFSILLKAQEPEPAKIYLKIDDIYKVELPSSISTEHKWILEPTYDSSFIAFQGHEYVASDSKELKKDDGKDVFTFKALKKGEVKVRFFLKPKYGKHIPRIENYLFIIGKK